MFRPILLSFALTTVIAHAVLAEEEQPSQDLSSRSDSCPNDESRPSAVEIIVKEPNYDDSGHLDTSKTLAEIRQIASSFMANSHASVVAFADVAFTIGYKYSTRYYSIPNKNKECHWVEKIVFEFSFKKPPTVLFPKELYEARDDDGGVCYDQIYAHEMQHVQDYETVFEEIAVTIEQDERFLPDRSIPNRHQSLEFDTHRGDASARAQAKIDKLIANYYTPIVQQTIAEIKLNMQERGALLDTSLEYERITELCSEMIDYIR